MLVKICNICLLHSLLSRLHLFLMPNDADPHCKFYGQMCIWPHSSSWMSVPDEPSPGLFHSFYHTLTNDNSCHMFSIWEIQGEAGEKRGWGILWAKRWAASREKSQWCLLLTESPPMCHQLTAAPWKYINYVTPSRNSYWTDPCHRCGPNPNPSWVTLAVDILLL